VRAIAIRPMVADLLHLRLRQVRVTQSHNAAGCAQRMAEPDRPGADGRLLADVQRTDVIADGVSVERGEISHG